jgi:hypothetical protein
MMMVATRTATIRDEDGRTVQLTAGVSYVDSQHELVLRHPDLFGPPEPGRERSREAIRPAGERVHFVPAGSAEGIAAATPSRPRRAQLPRPKADYGREKWRLHAHTPDLSAVALDRPSHVRVKLDAWPTILEIVERTTAVDGCESGGLLLGKSWHDFVQVVEASGPGPAAVREPHRLAPDAAYDSAVAIEGRRRGFAPAGCWHVHPNGFRAPSRGDLEAAHALRELDGVEPEVMLIVVPGQGPRWEAEAFVIFGHSCQRARLYTR